MLRKVQNHWKKRTYGGKHFHNIGLNKLFTEIVRSDITIEPSYDDRLRLNSAIENLDERDSRYYK